MRTINFTYIHLPAKLKIISEKQEEFMRLVTDWDLPIFRIDRLNLVMAALIIFVAVNVFSFSRRYLAGIANIGGIWPE